MPAVTAVRFGVIIAQLNAVLDRFETDVTGKRTSFELDRDVELDTHDEREYRAFVEARLDRQFEIGADPMAVQSLGPMVALTPAQAVSLYWMLYDEEAK